MTSMIHRGSLLMLCIFLATVSAPVAADELTRRIQMDMVALGYDPGSISGDATIETTRAIAKFQAENQLPITGEASPALADTLAAALERQRGGTPVASRPAATASGTPAAQDPAALKAAQQACLQEKIAAAQEAKKKKRGMGRLLNAAARIASRGGNHDVARTVGDVYAANATADDLAAAAKDLGITEDEVAACQNPGAR